MIESQKQARIYAQQHRIYERRIYPIILNALKKQTEPVINYILNVGSNPDLDIWIDPKVFRVPLRQAYEMVAQLAAKREYYYMRKIDGKGILDFLLDKWRLIFRDYATNYAYRIENELSETTKEEVRIALKYAYENTMNGDQTASYIRKQVGGIISRQRARVIARTEATTASNLGKEVGASEWLSEQNQQGYKQWIGREDKRERHSHNELNDRIIPIDEQWSVGGFDANAPGDVKLPGKERIQCRCTQLFMSKRRFDRMQVAKS